MMMTSCEIPSFAGDGALLMDVFSGDTAGIAATAATEERTSKGGAGGGAGGGRQPRWSRHETLVLIEAKRVEEAKSSRMKQEREKGIETGRGSTDSKWLSISQFCERMGVARSAAQCRKRWCNLSADYKRIRDWQSLRGKQSFWLMSNDIRKDNKLPGCFDHEVFDSLDKSLGNTLLNDAPDIIFDSGRQTAGDDVHAVADDGLFSDIEHPVPEGNMSRSVDKDIESPPPFESFNLSQGLYEQKFLDEKLGLAGFSEAYEEKADVTSGRRKRKQPSEECDEFRQELLSLLENNNNILNVYVESQNFNRQLDRNQRQEHSENLARVLGNLADTVARIAEKL